MNKTFLAFLTSTLISTSAIAETDPNEAILKALKVVDKPANFKELVEKSSQKQRQEAKKKTAKTNKKKLAKNSAKSLNKLKPAAGRKPTRKATTWFSSKKDGQRMSITFTSRPTYTRDVKGNKITLTFSDLVEYEIPEIPEKFRKGFKSLKEVSGDNEDLKVEIIVTDAYTFNVNHNSSRVFIDLTEKPPEELPEIKPEDIKPPTYEVVKDVNKPGIKINQDGELAERVNELEEEEEVVSTVQFDLNSRGIERFVFDFSKASKAAIFQKFGNLWMVFDTELEIEAPDGLESSEIFESFEVVNTNPLTIKLPLKQRAFAVADKIGSRWEIEFDTSLKYEMEKPLQVFENNEYIAINSSAAGEIIKVKDELFNLEFNVIPLAESGEGLEQEVSKKIAVFEPTVQGIVFRKVNEYADIKLNESGIKLFKTPEETKKDIVQKKKAIFEFKKWPQLSAKDFTELAQTIAKENRFEYARFLFTQKFYTEAAVILNGLQGYQAAFLNGAAYFMEGKYDLAIKAFNQVNLPFDVEETELLMWQLATNQKLSETHPHLIQDIEFTEKFRLPKSLNKYPGDISAEIILALAEKKGNDGEFEDALDYLNQMPKTAQVRQYLYRNYLNALFNSKQGKRARAKEAWQGLAEKTLDNRVRGRSYYNIALQDYELEKITRTELIDELDKRSVIWRGDSFEYEVLVKMGDLRYEEGLNSEALWNYKEAIKTFPKNPQNKDISKKMRKIYKETILQDFADRNSTYDVLRIYYEFEELKPVGEQGEHITLELAEKLVALDLLADAATVLQRYARKVTDKEEQVLVMTRVAILHYLNHRTDKAIKVLKDSEMNKMPKYLKRERDILRAEIYIRAKEYENAMLLLPNIGGERAQLFETQIRWLQQDWKGLIEAYKKQVNFTDNDIVRLAIAYAMTEDKDNLLNIKERFKNRMANSKYSKGFAFITDEVDIDYKDLSESLKIELAKETLNDYKERLNFDELKKPTT